MGSDLPAQFKQYVNKWFILFGINWIFPFPTNRCDLKFKLIGLEEWKRFGPSSTTVLMVQLVETWTCGLMDSGSTPGYATCSWWLFFLTPYQVSTQCLSTSEWLTRGGRRSRCVHFCAMHSQCLPKTVVSRYKDTNLIMWRCSYICATRRKSLGNEVVFFLVFIVCHNAETGNRTQRVFGVWVCVCMCVCVCARVGDM